MLNRIHHLTDDELTKELAGRTDLTSIEHELLDRLIRARAVIVDLETDVPACHPTGQQGAKVVLPVVETPA